MENITRKKFITFSLLLLSSVVIICFIIDLQEEIDNYYQEAAIMKKEQAICSKIINDKQYANTASCEKRVRMTIEGNLPMH